MSTRLSTEELDALLADILAYNPLDSDGTDLLSRCYNALEESATVRRALRDLTAALEHSPIWDDWKDVPEVVAARAVLSENPSSE